MPEIPRNIFAVLMSFKKHKNNQISHPIFRKYRWYDWPNASAEEKEQMRKELEDKFGYL